jgi:hypothetical protein
MPAVKYIFKHLKATSLCYKQRDSSILTGHTDANWVEYSHEKVFYNDISLGWEKHPLLGIAKNKLSLSSTKVEFMALTEGTKEAIWLCKLLQEIQVLQGTAPTMIIGDNQ